ncbi:MAG: aminotransferase class I/II-fold pyridoxal phosphate-dependent enzyme [Clostridiales Family XIII bacterium]|jgi:histidinol-phosphate aminotransferase|nr:aminotransferase class I/II-fold pyridoxal phosphate-dependent enzyme [Clostridiales Family XIII bacterium]
MASAGFTDKLINIEPYIPGEQSASPGLIKLNTNENPFPPSPAVSAAIARVSGDELARYPAPDADKLCGALAEYYGVARERVFAANGSDEVLAFAFRAFFNAELPVLFADVTYTFYPVWCRLFGIPYGEVPLTADFRIDAGGYLRENGGIVISNPNAPTSLAEDSSLIESIVRRNQGSVVIIDEAYAEFGAQSALPLTEKYENLLVTRTFSKSRALAGLRIGYAIGSTKLIDTLATVKNAFNSYTLDHVAIAAGVASLADDAYYRAKIEELTAIRDTYAELLRGLGFEVLPGKTNFLFIRHPDINAADLSAYLAEKNILVRHFKTPRIEEYLRVTVGTEGQMRAFTDAVRAYRGIL